MGVPICIIGQSLARHNYPVLCYFLDNRLSLLLSQGIGRIKVDSFSPFTAYLEKKLSKVLSPQLKILSLDVHIKGGEASPPIDSLIAILYTILREIGREGSLIHPLLKKLAISDERARIVFEAMKNRGLTAYRKGEGLMRLENDFPWTIGLCLKTPFRFKLSEFKGFEEPLNAVIHALGRLIIVVARSIIDGDFEVFREALTKYSRLSLAMSNLPFTVFRAYEKLSNVKGVACKVDEDFRGLMLFSERKDLLNECLNVAGKMGFQVAYLRS